MDDQTIIVQINTEINNNNNIILKDSSKLLHKGEFG